MKLNIKNSRLEMYKSTKEKALEYLEYISDEVAEYQKDVQIYKKKIFEFSSIEELIATIHHSNIIYLGDFHTFDQSSKNMERLLKTLFSQKDELILGVEFISIENQHYINNFLNGDITEREFLELINYKESWRFPWIHYKPFFQMAKENNFKIIALNSEGSLKDRDLAAAKVILKNHQENKNALFFILFGELHILPKRLPAIVQDLANSEIKDVIIHQNIEEIYWRIYDMNEALASKSSIVKFGPNEFSLQNSPPWIKYESMIYWYENLCDDPEFDLHDYIIETGLKLFNGNIYENFLYLCQNLNNSLNLNIEEDLIEDFNIYDHRSLELIYEKMENSNLSKEDKIFFQNLIHQGELFIIPNSNSYYCPSYSINRISLLAGFHLFNLIKNNHQMPNDKLQRFTYWTFMNYFGYFSSKIFNPFRKCDLVKDLEQKHTQRPENPVLNLLHQLFHEKIEDIEIEQMENLDIFESSKKLGNLMAEISFNSNSESNDIFETIINLIGRCNFEIKNLKQLLSKMISETDNFFDTSKNLL